MKCFFVLEKRHNGKKLCKWEFNYEKTNSRELHLEMVGDKVTYVRVY